MAKDVADAVGRDRVAAVFDHNPDIQSPFPDVPIYHDEKDLARFDCAWKEYYYVPALGWRRGPIRAEIGAMLESYGFKPMTVIHRTAYLSDTVQLGKSDIISSGANLHSDVRVGDYCKINYGSIISHDCVLQDNVDIAPGCIILGEVHIGRNTAIGAGTLVFPRVHIGDNVTIGAGSVVQDDVEDGLKLICNRRERIIL